MVGGHRFDPCRTHHPVWLSGSLWRLANLARRGRAFLLSTCGLSVPVGALGRIEPPVSAAKNPVPGADVRPNSWCACLDEIARVHAPHQ
jgi:hypothetical protein